MDSFNALEDAFMGILQTSIQIPKYVKWGKMSQSEKDHFGDHLSIFVLRAVCSIFCFFQSVIFTYRATYRTDSMMLQKLEFAQSCRNSNLENRCSMKLCFHCGGKRKRFTAVYIFVILNTTDEQSDEQYQTMIAPNSVNSLYMFRTMLGFGLSIIFLWMFLGPLPDFWQGIVHVQCWINVLDTAGREARNRYLWCCTCLWEALWS